MSTASETTGDGDRATLAFPFELRVGRLDIGQKKNIRRAKRIACDSL